MSPAPDLKRIDRRRLDALMCTPLETWTADDQAFLAEQVAVLGDIWAYLESALAPAAEVFWGIATDLYERLSELDYDLIRDMPQTEPFRVPVDPRGKA